MGLSQEPSGFTPSSPPEWGMGVQRDFQAPNAGMRGRLVMAVLN